MAWPLDWSQTEILDTFDRNSGVYPAFYGGSLGSAWNPGTKQFGTMNLGPTNESNAACPVFNGGLPNAPVPATALYASEAPSFLHTTKWCVLWNQRMDYCLGMTASASSLGHGRVGLVFCSDGVLLGSDPTVNLIPTNACNGCGEPLWDKLWLYVIAGGYLWGWSDGLWQLDWTEGCTWVGWPTAPETEVRLIWDDASSEWRIYISRSSWASYLVYSTNPAAYPNSQCEPAGNTYVFRPDLTVGDSTDGPAFVGIGRMGLVPQNAYSVRFENTATYGDPINYLRAYRWHDGIPYLVASTATPINGGDYFNMYVAVTRNQTHAYVECEGASLSSSLNFPLDPAGLGRRFGITTGTSANIARGQLYEERPHVFSIGFYFTSRRFDFPVFLSVDKNRVIIPTADYDLTATEGTENDYGVYDLSAYACANRGNGILQVGGP